MIARGPPQSTLSLSTQDQLPFHRWYRMHRVKFMGLGVRLGDARQGSAVDPKAFTQLAIFGTSKADAHASWDKTQ